MTLDPRLRNDPEYRDIYPRLEAVQDRSNRTVLKRIFFLKALATEDERFSAPQLSVRLDGLAEWVPRPRLRNIRNDAAHRSD